jgi:hypothetical protein
MSTKADKQRLKKKDKQVIIRTKHGLPVLWDYSMCASPGVSRLNGKYH